MCQTDGQKEREKQLYFKSRETTRKSTNKNLTCNINAEEVIITGIWHTVYNTYKLDIVAQRNILLTSTNYRLYIVVMTFGSLQ